MGKGIILRVPDGTVLSPELTTSLGKLLPGYVLETYQKVPDYKKSYARRIQSLYDAFLFVIDAYPLDPKFSVYKAETLKKYVAACKKACTSTGATIEVLQKELEKFTAQVVQVIAENWQWPKGKSVEAATACLNEAECFQMMMVPGRPEIATLTLLADGEGGKEYVLQMDRGVAAHYPLLIKELEQLKTAKTPKTPSWFRKLPEYQQVFFCHLNSTTKPAEVEAELDKFTKEWEGIKTKYPDWVNDLGRIHKNTAPFPEWFTKLNPAIKEMMRVLAAKPLLVDDQLKLFKQNIHSLSSNEEFKGTLAWVTITPHWYLNLCTVQQSFLGHVLKHAPSIEEAMSYISSRLRTVPVLSNYRGHKLSRINAKGEVTQPFDERFGASHIASRDVLKAPAGVQARHSSSNLEKAFGAAKAGVPRLLQTLISPLHGAEYLPDAILKRLPPDLKLHGQLADAVSRSKMDTLLVHNHPLNLAKYIYYTATNDPNSAAILKLAREKVAQFPALEPLITDYQNTLDSARGSATVKDHYGRELFLSSLEQLIILTMKGFSFGSCASGKDRKGLQYLHDDAMIMFYLLYKTWPKFNSADKTERARFVAIFATLYVTRHHQINAGLNAPGSEGIKTPSMYLPKDIRDAIKLATGSATFELNHDDRLATNNEVKNISRSLKDHFSPENDYKATLMAIQLGEQTCTNLYDVLTKLINQTPCFSTIPRKPTTMLTSGVTYFASTVSKVMVGTAKVMAGTVSKAAKETSQPSLPTGIKEILVVFAQPDAGNNNVQRIAKIFAIILERLKLAPKDADRSEHTNSVYNRVNKLFEAKSGAVLQTLAEQAVAEWATLYEASKLELSTKVAGKASTPAAAPALAK